MGEQLKRSFTASWKWIKTQELVFCFLKTNALLSKVKGNIFMCVNEMFCCALP